MKYCFLFVLLYGTCAFACSCAEPNGVATKANTDKYDVVFLGNVDSVAVCQGKSIAYMQVGELFKGTFARQIPVYFDCSSSCQLSFSKGETWLVYADFFKYGKLETRFCSRSRKFFEREEEDYYKTNNQMRFREELDFLRAHFSGPTTAGNTAEVLDTGRELIKPKGTRLISILLFSLLGFGVIYYLLKRLLK